MMIILITGWSRRGAVRSKTWDSGECGQFTSLPRPPQWIRFYSTRFQSIILYSIQASPPPTPAKTLNCQERECDQLGIFGSTWPTGGSGQFSGNSGADNRLQHEWQLQICRIVCRHQSSPNRDGVEQTVGLLNKWWAEAVGKKTGQETSTLKMKKGSPIQKNPLLFLTWTPLSITNSCTESNADNPKQTVSLKCINIGDLIQRQS